MLNFIDVVDWVSVVFSWGSGATHDVPGREAERVVGFG